MVKNNILLSVLVASFAMPVFASLIPSKCPCPTVVEKAAFVGTFAAVDAVSSKYTCLPKAVEFYSNTSGAVVTVGSANVALEAEKHAQSAASSSASATAGASEEALAAATSAAAASSATVEAVSNATSNKSKSIAETLRSITKTALNTEVSLGLTTVGVDGGVNVKVVPAALKVAATYTIYQAAKIAIAKVQERFQK